MKRKTLLPLTLLCLLALSCSSDKSDAAPAPGGTAPAFTAANSKGSQTSLSDFKGKYVVLEWFNDGCPYVKKHYNSSNMQGLQKEFTGKGVVWLTILSSAPGKQGHRTAEEINAMMAEKQGAPTAILLDPEGKVGQLYGAKTTPHMFVIDPQGKVIYQGAIDSTSSSNPEDIPNSVNYVKKALNEAMAGRPVETAATAPYGCSVKYQ